MEILQEIQMHTLSKLQNFLVSFIASKKFPKFLRRNFHWKFPPVFNFQSKEKKILIALVVRRVSDIVVWLHITANKCQKARAEGFDQILMRVWFCIPFTQMVNMCFLKKKKSDCLAKENVDIKSLQYYWRLWLKF